MGRGYVGGVLYLGEGYEHTALRRADAQCSVPMSQDECTILRREQVVRGEGGESDRLLHSMGDIL